MIFYRIGDFYHYHSDNHRHHIHSSKVSIKEMWEDGTNDIRFSLDITGRSNKLDIQERFTPSEVTDRHGNSYGTTVDDVLAGINTGTDVNIIDGVNPPVIIPFNRITNQTTLTAQASVGGFQITVASAAGAVTTSKLNYLKIFDATSDRFSQFAIKGVAGNVITLDRLIDYDYPIGSNVNIGRTNMGGENGTIASPIRYGIRGSIDINSEFNITRILITAKTDSAVNLAEFCDIPELANGLSLRRIASGETRNIFNIKTNEDIVGLAYDWTPYATSNPSQGQNGMASRLTFAGQNKMGVAIRLKAGEELEIVIADDLGDIDELSIMAEGHIHTETY